MTRKNGTKHDDILRGGNGADLLSGLGGDDTLFGTNGNDRLDGGKGDDELLGGAGKDLLLPGKGGADAMDGGAGIDTVSYANFKTTLGIALNITSRSTAGTDDAEGDTFLNIENFIGSQGSDTMLFNTDVIAGLGLVFGGGGDDVLSAPGGIMRGDKGNDSLFCDAGGATVDTVWLQLNKGQDTVHNFTDGQDKIRISGKEFGIGALLNSDEIFQRGIDSNATGTKAQFIFRRDIEQLYFDPDGTGDRPAVLLVDFDGSSSVSFLDLHDFEIV